MKNRGDQKNKLVFLPKNVRGQVTIFIIAGIAIVALVTLLFFFMRGVVPEINGGGSNSLKNPEQIVSSCIKEKTIETYPKLLLGGGYIKEEPIKTMEFEYKEIPYLCYTPSLYSRCFSVNPLLMNHLVLEMSNELDPLIDECFLELQETLADDSYFVEMDEGKSFEVAILPDTIRVLVNKEVEISKAEKTSRYNEFVSISQSPVYEIAEVTNRVIEEESKYCNIQLAQITQGYSNIEVNRFVTGDKNRIYTITDKDTNLKWRFAIKGCMIPVPE